MSWEEVNGKLTKKFSFKDFIQALAFVNAAGAIAEKMQHHPDIFMHDYKNVTISTRTHDENAITQKDYDLATSIDRAREEL